MRLRLSLLLLCVLFLAGASTPSWSQNRAIHSSGTAGGGGILEITIETFGTLVGVNACKTERYTINVPIPAGATCQIMTQAIYDVLVVSLAGVFDVSLSLPGCTVFLRRDDGDPECTYFEAKVRGDWQGMTFTVVDDPIPVEETTWSWLKSRSWRSALRGEVFAPRR